MDVLCKNGRFVKREQALVEENFYRLIKPGKTTIADVYRTLRALHEDF